MSPGRGSFDLNPQVENRCSVGSQQQGLGVSCCHLLSLVTIFFFSFLLNSALCHDLFQPLFILDPSHSAPWLKLLRVCTMSLTCTHALVHAWLWSCARKQPTSFLCSPGLTYLATHSTAILTQMYWKSDIWRRLAASSMRLCFLVCVHRP